MYLCSTADVELEKKNQSGRDMCFPHQDEVCIHLHKTLINCKYVIIIFNQLQGYF